MVEVTSRPTRELGLLARWRYVLRTTNPPEGKVDVVSKWLVLTRAAVLPMTITANAITGQPRAAVNATRMTRSAAFTTSDAAARPLRLIIPESTGWGA
jgi:hypothetical protein